MSKEREVVILSIEEVDCGVIVGIYTEGTVLAFSIGHLHFGLQLFDQLRALLIPRVIDENGVERQSCDEIDDLAFGRQDGHGAVDTEIPNARVFNFLYSAHQ